MDLNTLIENSILFWSGSAGHWRWMEFTVVARLIFSLFSALFAGAAAAYVSYTRRLYHLSLYFMLYCILLTSFSLSFLHSLHLSPTPLLLCTCINTPCVNHWLMQTMFFQLDIFVPVTVEYSPPWHEPPSLSSSPVINDALLLALFYGSHRSIPRVH